MGQTRMGNELGTPVLEVKNVSKTFGGVVHALRGVSLSVGHSEMVGVVGENGAGKTTLMKILVGVHRPDGGQLACNGRDTPFPNDPHDAARKGISIVYQEKGVIPSIKVYQFLFLGYETVHSGRFGLDSARMRAEAASILDEFHVSCAVDDFMYELPLATQKMVEIARAVLSIRLEQGADHEASVIILDEPTAPLTVEERRELMRNITMLKKTTSFVFVTHIMQEVMECMDRVVVLRDGQLVGQYDMSTDKVTEEDMVRLIVGKDVSAGRTKPASVTTPFEDVVLSLDGLTRNGSFYDVSLDVHRGECVGIYGPAGSGKSEVIKALAGLLAIDSGRLCVKGDATGHKEPAHHRLNRGIGYFSGETASQLFFDWSITKNISILNLPKVVRTVLQIIGFDREKEIARRILETLKIKAPDVNTDVFTLSGGSKQKVTVGKWFERRPDILLLEDPTIGIDVGSRQDIYETISRLKQSGVSMILVGDDPKEYYALCDRVLIMKQGTMQETITSERFKEVIET